MDSDGHTISPEQITTAAPARPNVPLDLPDDVILNILALGTSRLRKSDAHGLPTHLELVHFTCQRLRMLFSPFCQDLTLQMFSNWEYVST